MILKVAWILLVLAGFFYWLAQLIAAIRTIRSVPVLENIPEDELPHYPKVSVIMPARNEERSMGKALEKRLNDPYPNIEYIIVNDRSTDRTGEIVDAFAEKDPRVRPLHIRELPEGWLGKLYAMDQGVRKATGDWLLFSDVDVHVKPGAVEKAVAYAEARNIDHLALFPEIYPVSFFIDILSTIFVRMISLGVKLWEVEDPNSKTAVGSGSFNLVKRSAFERTGAFETIKLDQADDVALGQILKQTGSRQVLLNGRNWVGVVFYRSLREAVVAVERPTYTALGNFSFARIFLAGWVLLWLELSPYLAFVPFGIPYYQAFAALMVLLALITPVLLNHWYRRPVWSAFFAPLGAVITVYLIWRSGLLGALRGGVYWRGTFYSTETLKKNQKLKL